MLDLVFLCYRQYDLRESSKRSEVFIDLTEFCGQLVEAKCLAVNPRDNNYLAVGANGPFVRLYDIRMIHNYRSASGAVPCQVVPRASWMLPVPGLRRVLFFLTQEVCASGNISSRAHVLREAEADSRWSRPVLCRRC